MPVTWPVTWSRVPRSATWTVALPATVHANKATERGLCGQRRVVTMRATAASRSPSPSARKPDASRERSAAPRAESPSGDGRSAASARQPRRYRRIASEAQPETRVRRDAQCPGMLIKIGHTIIYCNITYSTSCTRTLARARCARTSARTHARATIPEAREGRKVVADGHQKIVLHGA